MKIWHIGASSSPQKVCGVNNTVWLVAREQVIMGHDVTLLVNNIPDNSALKFIEKTGLKVIDVSANVWHYSPKKIKDLLINDRPDIVHMHSVFVPKQARLGKILRSQNIPYLITPHAMTPELMQRGRLKKFFYSWLIEKPRFLDAAAISVVTPKEEQSVRDFVPQYSGIIRWVPNPIDIQTLKDTKWKAEIEQKLVIYLGRFDVLHKGIDKLVEIGRLLPDVQFHLYGTRNKKNNSLFNKVMINIPENVHFYQPIFGIEKLEKMSNASLYIQMSRWEVFGISIAEAMYVGLPCAVSSTINLAEVIKSSDLGLVLSQNIQEAAEQLRAVFQQPKQLQEWSERSQEFAREQFDPRSVSEKYLHLYEEILSG
ncbi:glycosyltransferase family 4 protein [Laspinema olomoucense]|uniref:glycosyltransferase family 4 protein n=1 Tax=Laspinema olomoucense TaxID=3231600 RepID=UPI0021BAA2DB|nr:glycosyltransferase family 4 protein [Laspinema sp. D3a]MCT7990843.1 glycosyltransferase family 4 protein [Laspinema sp. D3a]